MIESKGSRSVCIAVEDHEPTLALLKLIFKEELGYKVISATNYETAVKELEANDPQIVILDKLLPDGDGLELLRSMRKNPKLAGTPVLFITASALSNAEVDEIRENNAIIVNKPFQVEELELAARRAAA